MVKCKKMEIILTTYHSKETRLIAQLFLRTLLSGYYLYQGSKKRTTALVVSLEGELGSGKTEFMKGIGESIKKKKEVSSPTFLIMKKYLLGSNKKLFKNIWHLDCYRLNNFKELENLGFKDLLKEKENLIFIEWGDKIKKYLPKNHLTIKFKIKNDNQRILFFKIPLRIYYGGKIINYR